ncbi:exodeoxyribonuclease III [Buchananella hordeovulneris]|uniref:Exodeoxyribonuclease III n=1 Tax=Buchananella hordeovulneris TaxID=52770 RepID=A0A1Q5PZF4_9ACTO|nr:exodeoxyribonuclease III [Buchananella hordeovulneris]OKL52825.1 exodeoxyribonuclease III [Buchananella hordeovulneris]
MRIATVNVNGIRAAYKRGMETWLTTSAPDVLLLQEVRAPLGTVAAHLGDGWHVAEDVCRIKGRAGVAVASRVAPLATRSGAYPDEVDVDTGRWVEVDLPGPERPLTVVSTYLHSGTVGTEKMDQKYAHLAKVGQRLAELAAQAAAGERDVVVGGDYNVVLGADDIKNWKGNHNKTAGALDDEIAHLLRWRDKLGYADVVRLLVPSGPGPYTWWSWRGQAFDNNAGWRIDHQFVTPRLAAAATAAEVERAASYAERFSDHAPLVVTYQL